MAKKALPQQDLLRQLLRYDPTSGKLFWKHRTRDMFESGAYSADHKCKMWNGKNAGNEAFTAFSNGYKNGSINGTNYSAHRVIWTLVHGDCAYEHIDHKNGDRADNRIENLRTVTNAENMMNKGIYSCNSSGVTGVYWHKQSKHWRAELAFQGKRINLGYHLDFDIAVALRKTAERLYGFSDRHGT